MVEGGEAAAADAAVSSERARHSETSAELELASERAGSIDREADGLRAEISHLARMNGESAVNNRMSRDVERLQGRMRDADLEHGGARCSSGTWTRRGNWQR